MPRARTASAQKPAPHCLPAQNPRALNVDPPLSPAGYIVTRSHSEAVKASDSRTIEYNATVHAAAGVGTCAMRHAVSYVLLRAVLVFQ